METPDNEVLMRTLKKRQTREIASRLLGSILIADEVRLSRLPPEQQAEQGMSSSEMIDLALTLAMALIARTRLLRIQEVDDE